MQKIILALLLWATTLKAQDTTSASRERWEKAFAERAKAMEDRSGLKFGVEWKPIVAFGLPANEPPSKFGEGFVAGYFPNSRSFLISPTASGDTSHYTIDHELGHALVDQISWRNVGKGASLEDYSTLEGDEQIGMKIIFEGLAICLGYESVPSDLKNIGNGPELFPEGPKDVRWEMRAYQYNGGCWLVRPILESCGEQGIVYLITNRLRFKDGNVRIAAENYQHVALRDCIKKESPVR